MEIFNRPQFTGRKNVLILCRNKTQKRDKNNNIIHDKVILTKDRIKEAFAKQNNLNMYSIPSD